MDGFDRETGEVIEQRPQLPAMAESRPQNLIFASPECGEVFGALCDMQGEMEAPKRTKHAKVKGRTRTGAEYDYSYDYAPLDEIIRVIRAPAKAAGISYRQFLAVRGGQHVMRTIVAHRSGQWFGCDYPIFWDESRGMQGFASGTTYARRYGLSLAFGIAPEDDDDANVADGNVATVQDRRQTASRGRTATKAPETTAVPPPPTNGTTAPVEATSELAKPPTMEEKRKAARDHNEMVEGIDGASAPEHIDQIMASQDWKDLVALMKRVGEGARMDRLTKHAEERRLALADGPMTVGEMG